MVDKRNTKVTQIIKKLQVKYNTAADSINGAAEAEQTRKRVKSRLSLEE
jgi:hypothetical protein